MVDVVAEQSCGNNWDKATSKNIMEFMSIYSYVTAKQRYQQSEMKKQYEIMKSKTHK